MKYSRLNLQRAITGSVPVRRASMSGSQGGAGCEYCGPMVKMSPKTNKKSVFYVRPSQPNCLRIQSSWPSSHSRSISMRDRGALLPHRNCGLQIEVYVVVCRQHDPGERDRRVEDSRIHLHANNERRPEYELPTISDFTFDII
jgi:hypothetical protein